MPESKTEKTTDAAAIEAFAEVLHMVRSSLRVERENVANPLWWCLREDLKHECRVAAAEALGLPAPAAVS